MLSFAVSTPVRDSAQVNGLDREFLLQEFVAKFDRRALPSERPEIRGRASSSYDRGRGVLILFGGITPSGASGDLWEWNERWVQRFPAGAVPDGRSGAMMVFDGARGVTVLFGGEVGGAPVDDTWTWNGSVWNDLTPDTSATARRDAMMAYDPVEGITLLFGGFDESGGVLGDTWIWNGFDWALQAPTSAPPARAFGAMEFSPGSGGILLFGGEDEAAQRFDDTWLWTGGDWQPLSPSTTPPARSRARLVRVDDPTDSAPAEPQLIGGRVGAANDYVWTGSDWQIARAADSAESYESPWVGYHEARDALLYFSGIDPFIASQYYQELLILDENQWRVVSPNTVQPPAYRANMLAYYPEAEASVFYGGYIQSVGSTTRLNDVYTWNGKVWKNITSSATPVAAGRHSAVLYYDTTSRALSVYSGSTGGPFDHRALLFSGGSFSWLSRALLMPNPGEMEGYAAAYGPGSTGVNNFLYLFPTNSSTLWRYTGIFWSAAPTSTPSPPQRSQAAMVVDTERREVLLFGGRTSTERNDFWIYDIDSEAWREVPVVDPWPSPRSEHRMVYVPESDSTFLLFGGQDSEAPLADLWRWDGSTWSPVPIDGP
ncbi:MAG: kelch repeat-containing protein, partial [Myxococcota bacterium]